MASKEYLAAVVEVKKLAKDGFRLSELKGLKRSVAERLIDRGQLSATPLPRGDYIVNER